MKKILFIDRDGTLILEPENYQVDAWEKLEFYPEVFYYLRKIAEELDYTLVMVTNQDGLGTSGYSYEVFNPIQKFIIDSFAKENIVFQNIHIDTSTAANPSANRKPSIGMLQEYINNPTYDLANSLVIGDRWTDVQLAKNLGCKAIFLQQKADLGASELTSAEDLINSIALTTTYWKEIYEFLRLPIRTAQIHRKTKETDVFISLNLDGSGTANINTGLKFFDHMLEQIAKHGQLDLTIQVQGDLEVDEHHTIEDTGIALGACFYQALGNKIGVERYGFCLPMDDCLAQVALDFGGRSWLMWQAPFKREKIGDMPTEMFFHFFKSFADEAKANLNIKAEGYNEHHKIEAIFKAFAKAIKMAKTRNPNGMFLPTTKGML
ncbi:MAG: bifunctional histidinol-phosphatase/imidazoleglycerol-phosphate dehydratase HisB [Flavobacterium sp.]